MSDGKKNKWIKVRVSQSEYDEIKEKADAASVTVADLIRQSLCRVKVWTLGNKEVEREKIREISRVGQNINQIARFCNLHKSTCDTVQILTALVRIEKKINSFSLPPYSERDSALNKGVDDAY